MLNPLWGAFKYYQLNLDKILRGGSYYPIPKTNSVSSSKEEKRLAQGHTVDRWQKKKLGSNLEFANSKLHPPSIHIPICYSWNMNKNPRSPFWDFIPDSAQSPNPPRHHYAISRAVSRYSVSALPWLPLLRWPASAFVSIWSSLNREAWVALRSHQFDHRTAVLLKPFSVSPVF